ncbi:pili assembly chaperone, partial [Salmonella enterica subsp. enterica serovar Weltevreden]|nr:pili assembly chaperone [Salmonella enterica subsp. enterica serovar Weltevreden]
MHPQHSLLPMNKFFLLCAIYWILLHISLS